MTDLLEQLTGPMPVSLILEGPAGCGVTTTLRRLSDRLAEEPGVRVVHLVATADGPTREQLWTRIHEALPADLGTEPSTRGLPAFFHAEAAFEDLAARQERVVLVVDDVEVGLAHPDGLADAALQGALRSLASRFPSLALVFGSHADPSTLCALLDAEGSQLINIMTRIPVGARS